MKVIVYVLCHDEATLRVATARHAADPWARVLRIPTTPYLENVMYGEVLRDRQAEWADADFVGTLSWKAHTRMRLPDMTQFGETLRRGGYDVGALVVPRHVPDASRMVTAASEAHPPFRDVWVPLLQTLGFSAEEALSPAIPGFFCNYWMARPAWMERYMDFFAAARAALDTEPALQPALWSPSKYAGALSRDALRAIYGAPYYAMHPFVCERLPCFFFWRHGARVFRRGVD